MSYCEGNLMSAGSLVWIRRGNGCWWPGLVLGPDQAREKCSGPPRSGIPIKMLGREDKYIDWYDINKATHVKAFRCGEYDECIDSAKAYGSRSGVKAYTEGKNVRREDAILQALQLEKLHRGNDHVERSNSIITIDNSTTLFSGMLGHDKASIHMTKKFSVPGKVSDHNFHSSALLPREFGYAGMNNMHFSEKKRRKTLNDSEDEDTEGVTRMRGLQDLGMSILPKKVKSLKESRSPSLIKNLFSAKSSFNSCLPDHDTDGNEDYVSYFKQKRSQTVQLNDKVKKRSRLVPLTKVMEGTSRLLTSSTGHSNSFLGTSSQESSLNENQYKRDSSGEDIYNKVVMGSMIRIDTDGTGSSGDLVTSPEVRKEYNSEELESVSAENQLIQCSESGFISHLKERHDESASTSCSKQFFHARQKLYNGISQWCSKGRRNIKHLSSINKVSHNGFLERLDKTVNSNSLSLGNDNNIEKMLSLEDINDASPIHLEGFTSEVVVESAEAVNGLSYAEDYEALFSGDVYVSTVSSSDSPLHSDTSQTELIQSVVTYSLYDVEVKVQTTYHGPHVPFVSITSKLNDKAIIGHPITVEILDDDPHDDLSFEYSQEVSYADRNGTNRYAKFHRRVPGYPLTKIFSKKQTAFRKQGFSPRKIRSLSSLTLDQKNLKEERKLVEKMKSPVIACVPLRLVFSRLHEALGSSSSRLMT